jgi:hypothetical protein
LLDVELGDGRRLGTEEAEGEQDEVRLEDCRAGLSGDLREVGAKRTLLAASDLAHLPCVRAVLGPLDADRVDALDVAVAVGDERLGPE